MGSQWLHMNQSFLVCILVLNGLEEGFASCSRVGTHPRNMASVLRGMIQLEDEESEPRWRGHTCS